MKRTKYLVILYLSLFSVISFNACKDIEEEELDNMIVMMLAPSDNTVTDVTTINFWWEYLDGADYYNLQVVSPNFRYPERLIVDSNISSNQFQMTLTPGEYEWSVLGYNSASSSRFYIYSFSIDSTGSLSDQTVVLTSPINGDTTNKSEITFAWDELYMAEEYTIEIWQPDFNGARIYQETFDASTFNYTHSFTENGLYEWGISAENEISKTLFSKRTLFIDTIKPAKPILVYPSHGATVQSGTIQFTWQSPADGGSIITNLFEVYQDTLGGPFIQAYTNAESYSDSLGNGGYFWRVRAEDEAGNVGSPSNFNFFKVMTGDEK